MIFIIYPAMLTRLLYMCMITFYKWLRKGQSDDDMEPLPRQSGRCYFTENWQMLG